MVIAAVGVVSIPSSLIAAGFMEVVQSKNRKKIGGLSHPTGRAGDDWYEHRLRELRHVPPRPSPWGLKVDQMQIAVNEFLNGTEDENGHTQWTFFSRSGRIFIFTVIIANVIAVVVESVPSIDRAVGNEAG